VNAQPFQVLQHFRGQVILVSRITVLQVSGDAGLADLAGIGSRSMQKGAAGASGTIHNLLGEGEVVLAVVGFLVADEVNQASPSPAYPNHIKAFAQRPDGYGADSRVEPGNVTAARQNADGALLFVDIRHDECPYTTVLCEDRNMKK